MANKVAVVTGSNRGLGFGIVRELCKRGVNFVYLTARDEQRGLRAVEKLEQEGLKPKFLQLDISDRMSVHRIADYLKEKHSGIDILVNNAGVAPKNFTETTYEDSKHVIEINYRSYFNIQDYLFPILKQNARVINVSSDAGHLSIVKNTHWLEIFQKPDLKYADVNAFVDWFLASVKNDSVKGEEFGGNTILSYRITSIAICALTKIQQRDIDRNISINSIHPGFVKTEMNRNHGRFTIDEASKTPVYLALDADQSVKGKFVWYDRTELDWEDLNAQLECDDEDIVEYLESDGRL